MAKYPELIANFLKFIKINTRSDPNSSSVPSAKRESQFLTMLAGLLTDMGLALSLIHI